MCVGFVLGKPFWGVPKVSAAAGERDHQPAVVDANDPVDLLLYAELGNKLLTIPGMDGFFDYVFSYKKVCCYSLLAHSQVMPSVLVYQAKVV